MSTVLVVDDRSADRELTATVLGYAGYRVLQASSGAEALELARGEPPDLIITDILMPRMNGYQLVRELREDPELHSVSVIFSTANYTKDEVGRLAEACGVRHVLPKPCDAATMVSVVGDVLGVEREIAVPLDAKNFEREQQWLLNDKLVEKITELEVVSAERQRLVGQILQAHEDERRRLAEQLHDDPLQAVVAISMRLQSLQRGLHDPEDREAVDRLRLTIQAAIERLRAMVFALVPAELDAQGLAVAMQVYFEQVLSETGLDATLEDHLGPEPPPATRTLLYRMAQEALANVRKHAAASTVRVVLSERAGFYSVKITDDGRGFDPEEGLRARPGHLGLASMKERAMLAGGTLHVASAEGGGATVEIVLPEVIGQGEPAR
jgi:signal transduction histidine kinase